jgi:cation diffusion facilitator family transporter
VAGPDIAVERRALLTSIGVTAAIGALGIVWGILSGSQMILLDGIYALVGILVSWMLLLASGLAASEPNRRYPYGRESVTPLVIGVQGFVLLGTLVYAASEAVFSLRSGGSDVTPMWAIVYALITTVWSLATWRWLRGVTGRSDLLNAETTAWRVAALRGVGMVVGFSILAVLAGSRWDRAAPYVDPVMVLVTCAIFIPAPIRMVRDTIIELLEGAPHESIQRPVLDNVEAVSTRFDLDPPQVLMSKVGPKLYVEVEGMVDPAVTVAQQQQVRDDLLDRLDSLPYEIWLNLELVPRHDATTGEPDTNESK